MTLGCATIDTEHDQGEVLGGTLGGLHRDDIQRVVANILADTDRAVEIRVRPEPMPHPHHFVVEWRYMEYDYGAMAWQPLMEQDDDACL